MQYLYAYLTLSLIYKFVCIKVVGVFILLTQHISVLKEIYIFSVNRCFRFSPAYNTLFITPDISFTYKNGEVLIWIPVLHHRLDRHRVRIIILNIDNKIPVWHYDLHEKWLNLKTPKILIYPEEFCDILEQKPIAGQLR